jgi:Domain of unknown function (DUF4192)
MTINPLASAEPAQPAASTPAPGSTGPRTSSGPRPGRKSRIRSPGPARRAPDTRVPQLPVRISSPASLLAVIPGLLGFVPADSIVVVGTDSPGDQVRLTLRYDVPDPGQPRSAAALAGHAVSVLAAQGVTAAVAAGYGGDEAVAPVAAALRERAAAAGIALTEVLRVADGRYWSFVCPDPECCPPEGTPFDSAGHPAAQALAGAGGQVLAARAELTASLAAVGGKRGAAMQRATARALAQLARCVSRLDRAGMEVSPARLTAALGQIAVQDAIRRTRAGEQVAYEQAAWLTVALRQLRVRDDAWARMDLEHRGAHLRLWTHLTRLARPGYAAAPAALLAFVAWQLGDGALANVALDRALADNPRYSMAVLLRQALDSGAPPSMARLPMTPEEVAAAYDEAEAR